MADEEKKKGVSRRIPRRERTGILAEHGYRHPLEMFDAGEDLIDSINAGNKRYQDWLDYGSVFDSGPEKFLRSIANMYSPRSLQEGAQEAGEIAVLGKLGKMGWDRLFPKGVLDRIRGIDRNIQRRQLSEK